MSGTQLIAEGNTTFRASTLRAVSSTALNSLEGGFQVDTLQNSATCYVVDVQATYRWFDASVAAPVNPTVIIPLGQSTSVPGRWFLEDGGGGGIIGQPCPSAIGVLGSGTIVFDVDVTTIAASILSPTTTVGCRLTGALLLDSEGSPIPTTGFLPVTLSFTAGALTGIVIDNGVTGGADAEDQFVHSIGDTQYGAGDNSDSPWSASVSSSTVAQFVYTAFGGATITSGAVELCPGPSPDGINGGQVQGPQGAQGPQGTTGSQGAQGTAGAQGSQGVQGAPGLQGPQGSVGATGLQGPQGAVGGTGAQGPQGATGSSGLQGPQGAQGVQGVQGTQGAVGSQGAQGTQGTQGVAGSTGSQGAQGVAGNSDCIANPSVGPLTGSGSVNFDFSVNDLGVPLTGQRIVYIEGWINLLDGSEGLAGFHTTFSGSLLIDSNAVLSAVDIDQFSDTIAAPVIGVSGGVLRVVLTLAAGQQATVGICTKNILTV